MINRRLKQIAELVPQGKIVLDIGTDHALLPIYLVNNKICPMAIGSDISDSAIKSAKENLKKYNCDKVKLYVSDGLKDINEKFDVITISGMGTSTILEILDTDNLPDNLIISSNNNLEILRKKMNQKGYAIKKEKVVYEKNKYYDIISYEKGKEKLSLFEIAYGKSSDLDYLSHLYKVEKKIYGVAPFKKRIKMHHYMYILKRNIKKLNTK